MLRKEKKKQAEGNDVIKESNMQFIFDWLVLVLCSTVQNERQDSEK